jgi:hypothetical protein
MVGWNCRKLNRVNPDVDRAELSDQCAGNGRLAGAGQSAQDNEHLSSGILAQSPGHPRRITNDRT